MAALVGLKFGCPHRDDTPQGLYSTFIILTYNLFACHSMDIALGMHKASKIVLRDVDLLDRRKPLFDYS